MPFPNTSWFVSLLLLGSALLVASQPHSEEAPLLHAERSFTVHLDAAPGQVFPLFGPTSEREWAPDGEPKMIFRHAAHWEHAINEALRKRRENAGH